MSMTTKPAINLCLVAGLFLLAFPLAAQDAAESAAITSEISPNGAGKIVVEARGVLPEVPVFFYGAVPAKIQVGKDQITHEITIRSTVLQGQAETLTYELRGPGDVTKVDGVPAWAVRQAGKTRYLDLHVQNAPKQINATVTLLQRNLKLPSSVEIAHIGPGKSTGFRSELSISYAPEVEGRVTNIEGILPLDVERKHTRFQTSTGGRLALSIGRKGGFAKPAVLRDANLVGQINEETQVASFILTGTASISEKGAKLPVLSGNAALNALPQTPGRLTVPSARNYVLEFPETGDFPIRLQFSAPLAESGGWTGFEFTVASSAVTPVSLTGIGAEVEFNSDHPLIPEKRGANWLGFLPASGRAVAGWKPARDTTEGKLFFTSTGTVETSVGPGLLRQTHEIDFKVLQGKLEKLSFRVGAGGEVVDVAGPDILGWTMFPGLNYNSLQIKLSKAIEGSAKFTIRTQSALDVFPVRVFPPEVTPNGAVRHSGFVRLSNQGSIRLEPANLIGLTQLAPTQFPGPESKARQVFVYRFPSAQFSYEIAADRIQPEVSVSQIVIYELAESDRVITADVELDIREAALREWDIRIPADFSVVSVTGASVADYVVGSEVEGTERNLKVIFGEEVSGRQLISLYLEKNDPAAAGIWELPRLTYPDAKTVRGDIGVAGTPGFRIVIGEVEWLVEKPLSYFPKQVANLQQAFRIRERGWNANMQVEQLEKSIQADVFHLYSLNDRTAYGSVLLNYFVTGAPVGEFAILVPEDVGNVFVEGKDVRTQRREGEVLTVTLHQPVIGSYTLLVTYEEDVEAAEGIVKPGRVTPQGVRGETGFIQVVSPQQVKFEVTVPSEALLELDDLELPAEFKLLSSAPSLAVYQYTTRPFELAASVEWYEPGQTVDQVVEFSTVNSRISADGELVTDLTYYVKSRGQRALRLTLPESMRLWNVAVAGQNVNARQDKGATLIPLPGGADPNQPIGVKLRLGKPAIKGKNPTLQLPVVAAPVLKTEWKIEGQAGHLLRAVGGTVEVPQDRLPATGFSWLVQHGLGAGFLVAFGVLGGAILVRRRGILRFFGLLLLVLAALGAGGGAVAAFDGAGRLVRHLQLDLPVLTANEVVSVEVTSVSVAWAYVSSGGVFLTVAGLLLIGWSFFGRRLNTVSRLGGGVLLGVGILLQRSGATWFFVLLASMIALGLFLPHFWRWVKDVWTWIKGDPKPPRKVDPPKPAETAVPLLIAGLMIAFSGNSEAKAPGGVAPDGFSPFDSMVQSWDLADNRLVASGELKLTGKTGDRFVLVKAPAVLTSFEGGQLHLTKEEVPGNGLCYVVSIPGNVEEAAPFRATFEFQREIADPVAGFFMSTGVAAVQEVNFSYEKAGWEFVCPSAVKIEPLRGEGSQAKLLLAPDWNPKMTIRPQRRDISSEETQFYVEGATLYTPGPGVVDGVHRVQVRPSQGQVSELTLPVPEGLTVSEVEGPVGPWQFDAESRDLRLVLEPAQTKTFAVIVRTQRGLDPLPSEVSLAPLTVKGTAGEVGLIALAFGADAQPEKVESETLSAVNLGDFDASLVAKGVVLHQVFRYGKDSGSLQVRVAPVAPEVRVVSKQVLSFGDERLVLGVNFSAQITRAGLFSLSFPLPDGLEVDSLSGAALHHWAELMEEGQRTIILHLNGKTLGQQNFALSLTGAAPSDVEEWKIPRFEIREASRQTGELVVRPTTGIRLRTTARQNVSEVDPRQIGGQAQGALAFRLLQRDWTLTLGIEKLDPWITGQILHDLKLREGQTRSTILANFRVQNASIRSLQIQLPISDEETLKTVRASGKAVSDFVRTAAGSDLWELQFKRRVVGDVEVRIEYERRGERENDLENLTLIQIPDARQISYHYAVRAGRLEVDVAEFTKGWQRADWNAVPQVLRESGDRTAPSLALRAVSPEGPLPVQLLRHKLAEALKLRVADGLLTTVVSPMGDRLTQVDLTIEVIQRSPLTVQLPTGGELFSIFVNEESVSLVRQGDAYQFYILPGSDDRTAKLQFVYATPGNDLRRLHLTSPSLNLPLEGIEWRVIVPKGFEMVSSAGNLEFLETQVGPTSYGFEAYSRKWQGKRQEQAQNAKQLLDKANAYLQAGEQKKAQLALNSVANQAGLDAASNEDARVQLENLETQQAVVGLNTRRQRLYLDNSPETGYGGNAQLEQGAASNPILLEGDLNYRPQEVSQLLQGNTSEDNAVLQRIAGRLVRNQKPSEPAPQAITITMPEEGTVYPFSRTVQVNENAPLTLKLTFASENRMSFGQIAVVCTMLLLITLGALVGTRRSRNHS